MYKHDFQKRFGQNFLKSIAIASRIVESLDTSIQNVIEVGPGDGKLTEILLNKGLNVFSVEIDQNLYPYLEAKFSDKPNFHLIKKDILEVNPKDLNLEKYSLIGSLPYNISKKIISKFMREDQKPNEMVLLIQKEVAHDYTAKPPKSTFLANYALIFGECKYLFTIPKEEFHPEPKVDGGVIKISIKVNDYDEKLVKFIKVGFITPRKTLSNNLSSTYQLSKDEIESEFSKIGINPKARPAEVTPENWKYLYDNLSKISK